MKFQTPEYHTNQSSNVAGQAFQVSLSAKFFETLFSGLYRYKDEAVIRELFCNAIDTHKVRDNMYAYMPQHYASVHAVQRHVVSEFMAEQNTRVEIHLPDALEPWLEIKDFGTGLSLEKIMGEAIPAHEGEVLIEGNVIVKEDEVPEGKGVIGEPGWYNGTMVFRSPENNEILRSAGLYTTLFDSTKGDSNDQIGAFGLGSKSPFAISDSFTVESRYNGEVHNYLMFLNEKRIPTCELATKDLDSRDPMPLPTLEKNGLTVRVPVRSSSYSAFAKQLSDLCRVLEPEEYPVVLNDTFFEGFTPISRENRLYDTYIQKAERKSHASTHYAVMGGVAYPIELNQLDEDSAALLERFPSTYTFFPLGALNIPPSREDLSYDQFTKAALSEKMSELRQGILDRAIEEVKYAQSQGPLWLVMIKGKYSDLYGSGFRKLLDRSFPPDERFHDGHLRYPTFHPEVDFSLPGAQAANYDFMLGATGSKGYFTVTRYTQYSRYEKDDARFEIKEMAEAVKEDRRITVIILDNMRCYAQKIKQYMDKNKDLGNVWLVNPNSNLMSWRDLELETQYSNAKEIKDAITQWVGTGKQMDYLQFADQFAEYYDGIIKPEVLFMSELPYEVLQLQGDIGMLEYHRYGSTSSNRSNRIIGQAFPSEEIMKVAEQGLKMIYIEYSGHNMVHEGMRDYTANLFQTIIAGGNRSNGLRVKADNEKGWQYMHEELGWYRRVVLVRKKAVPFLKANPAFFIDINDAVKLLQERMTPIMNGMEYGRFAGMGKELRFAAGNIAYHRWVLEQLGAKFDAKAKGGIDKWYTMTFDVQQRLRHSAKFALECEAKFKEAKEEYGATQFAQSPTELEACRELYGSKLSYRDMSKEFIAAQSVMPDFRLIEDQLARTIRVDKDMFSKTKNMSSRAPNKKPRNTRFSKNLVARERIRRGIEGYKILEYINKTYQVTMHNKLDGADDVLQSVLDQFKQNLRF